MKTPFQRLKKLSSPQILLAGLCLSLMMGCKPDPYIVYVTATPEGFVAPPQAIPTQAPAEIGGAAATFAPFAFTPIPQPPIPSFIPTPNATRVGLPDPVEQDIYVVQNGDTLGLIAQRFGVTTESLLDANKLSNENSLTIGQAILVPLGVSHHGTDTKLVPDSELVYGPTAWDFDVQAYATRFPGYINGYSEELEGYTLTGPQIVDRVALEASVNPRLLVALLEYESGWLTRPTPNEFERLYPMNYLDGNFVGLYRQLSWAANQLNAGYYGWKQDGLWVLLLADGTRVAFEPTLNAGTAGLQNLLGKTRGWAEWRAATGYSGFLQTYWGLFGDPFQYAVEPLIPLDLSQPELVFPWAAGETWYYTGGPHGGWASGTAWAALDFATGDQGQGCYVSESWATAAADGIIARSEFGIVVLDLDGDGYIGTGWTIFYLHLDLATRPIETGTQVRRGDPLGHPSCEGGYSNATHLHIARRYNGQWMPADCSACLVNEATPPFVMANWRAYSFQNEYDGSLVQGEAYREARQARDPINELTYEIEQ